jgi:histidine ammonia-lyase
MPVKSTICTNSGMMIAHVTAAALLNEAKVLSRAASVDSVPTSGGKEHHVSMGITAALKWRQVVENAERILAIALMAGGERLDYRRPLKPSVETEKSAVRAAHLGPAAGGRCALSNDIETLTRAIRQGRFG